MKNFGLISIAAIASALMATGSALAQGKDAPARAKAPTSGWYAGGAIGYGGYRTKYSQTHGTIARTGATAWTVNADEDDTMWKAYVGYRLTPYVSVEGGYWDFGRPSYSAAIATPVATTMDRSFSVDGFGADAALWLPLGIVDPILSNVSGFAKLGAIQTRVKASAAVPGGGLTPLPAESDDSLRAHWGVGVEYSVQRNWAARLEFETLNNAGDNSTFGTADIQMWSFGANYRF